MEHRFKRGRYDYGYAGNYGPSEQGSSRGYYTNYEYDYNHHAQRQHHTMNQYRHQDNRFEQRLHFNPSLKMQHDMYSERQGNKRSCQTMMQRKDLEMNLTHVQHSAPRMSYNAHIPQQNRLPEVAGSSPHSNSGHRTIHRTAGVSKKGKLCTRPFTTVDTLPYPAEGVEVVYTNDPADAESWLKNNVIDAAVDALGLDIEWKPQFVSKKNGGTENKTAVVQLAVEDSSLVLHVFHMKSFPKLLSGVLGDRNVLKVGSGIKGDVIKLIKDTGMLCDGRIDTQDYAKALGISQGVGLKNLSKQILDIDLNKPKKVSLSNWESFPLRKGQITYAALDAWISLKLYIKLREQLANKNKGASKPHIIEVGLDKPEMPQPYTCQKCNEIFESKKRFSRHKLRCNLLKAGQTNSSPEGNNQQINKSDEQIRSDQTGCLNANPKIHQKGSAIHHFNKTSIDEGSSSSYSDTVVLSEQSPKDDLCIICPVLECQVKCHGQNDFLEHIKIARHACCKECSRVFRSKVSSSHKKQHAAQRKDEV